MRARAAGFCVGVELAEDSIEVDFCSECCRSEE